MSNILLPLLENALAATLQSALSLDRVDSDSSIAVEVICGTSVVVISLRRILCNHHRLIVSLDLSELMHVLLKRRSVPCNPFALYYAKTISLYPKALFMALCASSTPRKVTSFAGTALAIAGPKPGKNALKPTFE